MDNDLRIILGDYESFVQSHTTEINEKEVIYYITLKRTIISCPECGSRMNIKDYRKCKVIHNMIRGKNTSLILKKRRLVCPQCNKVVTEGNPFTEKSHSRLSQTSELEIMNKLKEPTTTFSLVARFFNTSPTKVVEIFDKYGQMHRQPLPDIICIDEKHWRHKGQNRYMCVILNFKTMEIVDIIDGRTKKAWSSYTQIIDKKELAKVKYISIDMYETYRFVRNQYFPGAVLLCDSFHVIKNINKVLDDIRIKVGKRYQKDSTEYYLLKKFHFLILKNYNDIPFNKARYNKKLKRYIDYHQLLEIILSIDKELTEAYNLKEQYIAFNHYATSDNCREWLSRIIQEYASSGITGYISLSGTLINWFDEICASFNLVDGRRISNGPVEGINSRIDKILSNACGYQNFARMRNRLMYSLNKSSNPSSYAIDETIKREGKKRGSYKKKNQ